MTQDVAAVSFEDDENGLRTVTISGRLDIQGTNAIDARFAAITASAAKRVVVDISGLEFLASIGIRTLVGNAKAQQQRGGRMILHVGDNAPVAKVLSTMGIDTLIPMFTEMDKAREAAAA